MLQSTGDRLIQSRNKSDNNTITVRPERDHEMEILFMLLVFVITMTPVMWVLRKSLARGPREVGIGVMSIGMISMLLALIGFAFGVRNPINFIPGAILFGSGLIATAISTGKN